MVDHRHPPCPQRHHRGENLQRGPVSTAMHPTTAPQGDPQPDRPGHQPGDNRVPGVGEDVPGSPGERTQGIGRGAVALQLSYPALGADETVKETASVAGQERDTAGDLLDRLEGGARRQSENDPVTHQEAAHSPRSHQGENRKRRQLENLLHHGGDHHGGRRV